MDVVCTSFTTIKGLKRAVHGQKEDRSSSKNEILRKDKDADFLVDVVIELEEETIERGASVGYNEEEFVCHP